MASLCSDHSFIVLATVVTIVNYDHKTFIVQATVQKFNLIAGSFFTKID
jgi:hypothetical protein